MANKRRVKRSIHNGKIPNEPVGYCYCKAHYGYLSPKLMKKHKCLQKNCRYFQKFSEAQYWKELEVTSNATYIMKKMKKAFLSNDLDKELYNKCEKEYKKGYSHFLKYMRGNHLDLYESILDKRGDT